MDDLRDLYQEVILDHYKKPRNQGEPEGANRHADGKNPLCGDTISIHLVFDESDVVTGVGFSGAGCAISTASASLMTEAIKGKTRAEIEEIYEKFHDIVTGKGEDVTGLGKLAVLCGVQEFPARVKCASLAWHTMKAALTGDDETVTTE